MPRSTAVLLSRFASIRSRGYCSPALTPSFCGVEIFAPSASASPRPETPSHSMDADSEWEQQISAWSCVAVRRWIHSFCLASAGFDTDVSDWWLVLGARCEVLVAK